MFNRIVAVQVSDTTETESSNAAKYKIIKPHFKELLQKTQLFSILAVKTLSKTKREIYRLYQTLTHP